MIIWLILSELYTLHLFLSGWTIYNNKYIKTPQQITNGRKEEDYELLVSFVLHCLLFVGLFYYGHQATVSDPTDHAIYYQRFHQQNQERMDNIRSKLHYHCDICCFMIKDHTKHCRACNRCCDKFDHHCQWLNNCIGESNYRLFIWSTCFLTLYVIQTIVMDFHYLALYKVHDFQFEMENFAICLQAFFCVGILMACIQLLSWHFYFWRRGITTFTHI